MNRRRAIGEWSGQNTRTHAFFQVTCSAALCKRLLGALIRSKILLLIWRKTVRGQFGAVIGPKSDLLGQHGEGSCLSGANDRSATVSELEDRLFEFPTFSQPYSVRGGD